MRKRFEFEFRLLLFLHKLTKLDAEPIGLRFYNSYTDNGEAEPKKESLNPEASEHYVLVNGKNTIEIEPLGSSIAFKIYEKGEAGQETKLTLSLKDASVILGLLAQVIEEISTIKSKQVSH